MVLRVVGYQVIPGGYDIRIRLLFPLPQRGAFCTDFRLFQMQGSGFFLGLHTTLPHPSDRSG